MTEQPLPAYDGVEPYIFVTYAHEDVELVYPHIRWLQEQDFNIWWDEGISPGASWRTELADAIQGCSLLLYFVTPQSVVSDHCTREVNFALDQHRRPVLAVHMVETELPGALALSLSDRQAILQYAIEPKDYERKLVLAVATYVDQPVPSVSTHAPLRKYPRPTWSISVMGLLAGAIIASLTTWTVIRQEATKLQPLARFALDLPLGVTIPNTTAQPLVLSADGQIIFFSGNLLDNDNTRIYVRALNDLAAKPLPGTASGARSLLLSPDGESIIFYDMDDGGIKKIPVSGGRPSTIASNQGAGFGWSWGGDGTIVFSDESAIMRISESDWTSTTIVAGVKGKRYVQPHILDDGSAVLFTADPSGGYDSSRITAVSMETGRVRDLIDGSNPRVTSRGHLLFVRDHSIWAAPFDSVRLELTGTAAPVLDDVRLNLNSAAVFAVADNGSIVYVASKSASGMLAWVDLKGNQTPLPVPPALYGQPQISPDGRNAVVRIEQPDRQELWLYSFERGSFNRLHDNVITSLWSADGLKLIYSKSEPGKLTLVQRNVDGTGVEEILIDNKRMQFPTSQSRKGDLILYHECDNYIAACDIGQLTLSEEPTAELILQTEFSELHAALSPDSRWLAYESNRSGRVEVYVRPFPNVDSGRWQVSTEGGRQPVWSSNGKTLYYAAGPGMNRQMMAVGISSERGLNVAIPEPVFDFSSTFLDGIVRNHDLHPDDDRFLIAITPELKSERLIYIQNWLDEVERLVPTGR
jgi:Tol biopolymer transport system component